MIYLRSFSCSMYCSRSLGEREWRSICSLGFLQILDKIFVSSFLFICLINKEFRKVLMHFIVFVYFIYLLFQGWLFRRLGLLIGRLGFWNEGLRMIGFVILYGIVREWDTWSDCFWIDFIHVVLRAFFIAVIYYG